MKKHLLEIEYDFDFVLIGISSHEKDYRICWSLNNKLELDLIKTDPLEVRDKKQGEISVFSLFVCERPDEFIEYLIISNRCDKGLLIPEQKHIDYFFVIKGEVEDEEAEKIVNQIKEINFVLTAVRIDASVLKSKQNLIF